MPRKRKKIPPDVEAEVLTRSRRRCCLCVSLDGDTSVKTGQVAHLDRDPSNNALDNLVFLCLHHHEAYDAKSSQAKGLKPREVCRYRDELHRMVEDGSLMPAARIELGDGPASVAVGSNFGTIIVTSPGEQQDATAAEDTAISRYTQGVLLHESGDLMAALAKYTEALLAWPNWWAPLNNRANIYLADGAVDDALSDYDKAIAANPKVAIVHFNRAHGRDAKADFEGAAAGYTEAIRLDPKLMDAYYNRGNMRVRLGDYDAAIRDFGEAIRLDPDRALTYHNRGTAFGKKGELDKAVKDYDQAVDLDPGNALTHLDRGLVLSMKGEHEAAITDFNRVIELDPTNHDAFFRRGRAREATGDADGALKD